MPITHSPLAAIAVDAKELTPFYDFQNNKIAQITAECTLASSATGFPIIDIYYIYKYGTGVNDITDGSSTVTPPSGMWLGSITLRPGITTAQRSTSQILALPISGLTLGTPYISFLFINKSGVIVNPDSKFIITSAS